jgi:HK97 family phage major capsid protein
MTDPVLNVIPETEIKGLFEGLKSDVATLRGQMETDRQTTGLAIEKRADDLQKALDAVSDFSSRMDELVRKVDQNSFARSFGQSNGELKDALETYQAGFKAFDGEDGAKEFDAGCRPSLKNIVEGVFQAGDDEAASRFHAPRHAAILRVQKAADDAYAIDAMLRAQMDPNELAAYNARGGIKSTKTWKRYEQIAGTFQKAAGDLIDRTTEVANWIPTQYSANLYERVKIGLPLLGLFQEIAMSAGTMELPLDMNDHEAGRVTEITSNANANPYSDAVFQNSGAIATKATLVAEKLRSRYWVSMDATEDALIAILPLLNAKHSRNIGEAIEDMIVNGHTAGLDTGGTHFGKTNPPATTDARYCADGLRKLALAFTPTPSNRADMGNVKATVIAIRGIRAAMGEYGMDVSRLAYLFGMFGFVKLLDDSNVLTIEKFGSMATIHTGTMAMVDGCSVMVSRRIPQNANATGVIDGVTTNRTLAIAVNKDAFVLGNRRRITLGQTQHGSSDTVELFAFWRGDFQPIVPTATIAGVGVLYNVAGV